MLRLLVALFYFSAVAASADEYRPPSGGGSGTVTSVGDTFTGGLITIAGSPVTTSGTFAETVAGTSGGVVCFTSGTAWASGAALTANALVIGGGAGACPTTTATNATILTALGNAPTGSGGTLVESSGATLTTPALGVATATSINIGGATLGGNVLAVNGAAAFSDIEFVTNAGGATHGFSSLGTSDLSVYVGSTRTFSFNSVAFDLFGSSGSINIETNTNPTFTLGASQDAIIGRNGAAAFRFGAQDAAAPVAQTLGVQNVVAGTSNAAGVNLTLTGSLSTGSGASGDIIVQTGGTGAAATVQNAFATALTIKGATQQINAGGIINPATTFTPTAGSGAASVAGNDQRFVVTTGTAQTSVTVNFGHTWTAAPVCIVSSNSTASVVDVTSTSTTIITFGASVALTGGLLNVLCFGS